MPRPILSTRVLNRATLARQLLLERSTISPLDAVRQLVGLQAQVPRDPYTALWSRLDSFDPAALGELLERREVVRIVVMRGTIHLVTAQDCLRLRPLMQPILDAELARHPDAKRLRGVDLRRALAFASSLLAEQPLTGTELRQALAERFPELDAVALGIACRCKLPLVQVPPRGVWGQAAQARSTTATAWLGASLDASPSIDDVVLRYLGAFGPAGVADLATWCRLTGMREVVERLRPRLCSFADENGRELFDLPDGSRPDPDVPAPVRYLPEYDNVLLSHADRSRVVPAGRRGALRASWRIGRGSVLHDGFLCGVWRLERPRGSGSALLEVTLAARLAKRAVASVEAEGRRYLRFAAPDAETIDVRVLGPV